MGFRVIIMNNTFDILTWDMCERLVHIDKGALTEFGLKCLIRVDMIPKTTVCKYAAIEDNIFKFRRIKLNVRKMTLREKCVSK